MIKSYVRIVIIRELSQRENQLQSRMDHEEKIVYAKEKGYLRANDEIEEVKKSTYT